VSWLLLCCLLLRAWLAPGFFSLAAFCHPTSCPMKTMGYVFIACTFRMHLPRGRTAAASRDVDKILSATRLRFVQHEPRWFLQPLSTVRNHYSDFYFVTSEALGANRKTEQGGNSIRHQSALEPAVHPSFFPQGNVLVFSARQAVKNPWSRARCLACDSSAFSRA